MSSWWCSEIAVVETKEDFETNLANSQKEEMSNVKAFEDLKAAKDSVVVLVITVGLRPRGRA